MKGPNWILDVDNYPNPIHAQTQFTYLLPRDVSGMKLTVYTLDLRVIAVLENAPGAMGRQSFVWNSENIPTGSYVYQFEGKDDKGEKQTYFGRLVKVK